MTKKYMALLPILSFFVSGCASVMSGTDQDIAVHTNPEGALCILTREGQELRRVETPDTVRVSKLKHDIYVKCTKEGFHESTAHVNSGIQGSVFGNILLGGGIGWAVDSARGADNKYADVITVTMVPNNQALPESVKIDPNGKVTEVGDEEEPTEESPGEADTKTNPVEDPSSETTSVEKTPIAGADKPAEDTETEIKD